MGVAGLCTCHVACVTISQPDSDALSVLQTRNETLFYRVRVLFG